jgi:hypothetical protein
MFYNSFQVLSYVFASVSGAYFKCFICLQTYVAIVASGYFKVDQVLHLLSSFMLPSSVSSPLDAG